MEDNFIYALHSPFSHRPIYVGKTTRGMERPFDHIKDKTHNKKVQEWVRVLKTLGKNPVIVILEHGFDTVLIDAKEQFWIEYYTRKGNDLLNIQYVTSEMVQDGDFFESDLNDPLGDIRMYIKKRRKLLNLTQLDLSKKSGIGLRFIREVEQDAKTTFRMDTLIKLLMCVGRCKLTLRFDDF